MIGFDTSLFAALTIDAEFLSQNHAIMWRVGIFADFGNNSCCMHLFNGREG
jgi:hypothetical protein